MNILNHSKALRCEIKCNKYCAKYLIKYGIEPISKDYNYYYFAFNNEVANILYEANFLFKIFAKWEGYYGKQSN